MSAAPGLTERLFRFLHNEGDGGVWEHFDEKNARTLAAALAPIVAEEVAAAEVRALREAAAELRIDWVKNGRHQGLPGCYSTGYENWLNARADRLAAHTDGGQ